LRRTFENTPARAVCVRRGARGPQKKSSALVVAIAIIITCATLAPVAGAQRAAQAPQTSAAAQSAPQTQQSAQGGDPATTVSELLAAACRQDTEKFPGYLMSANAAYFHQLKPEQQLALLKRLVLLENPGRAILSTDNSGLSVLHCDTKSWTAVIHIGNPRVDQNLAFVPIEVKPDRQIDFGLINTSSGWKLISVGVLMLDLAQLQPQWDEDVMNETEAGAMNAMWKIESAIITYRNAFQKLPDTLAQLGPAPKDGISPDAASLLPADLIADHIAGYFFRYRIVPVGEDGKDFDFELAATPDEYTKTGRRSFYINGGGKLRGADKMGGPATAADPVIEDAPPDQNN
jgi:type II secretory pathway pseudopilin PulG